MVKKRCDPARGQRARERAPRHRKLSRAISDAGWYSFRSLLDAKCQKYGRDFVVIDRWSATSQTCSACGKHGGKKELKVRAWTCLHCGEHHDRDINAAKNIEVAGGLSETLNGRGSRFKTSIEAICDEPSTTPEKEGIMTHNVSYSDDWKFIDWKKLQKILFRLQRRIFKAIREEDTTLLK